MKTLLMKTQRLSFAVLLVLGLSAESWASVVTEIGADAGNTIPTAFLLPGGTTSIDGEIDSNQDTDLYKFTLSAAATFSIEVLEISPDAPRTLDMNLIVFNSLGQGLAGDDDGSSGTPVTTLGSRDSLLTLSLAAGDYFFAVGDNNIGAFESVADFNAGGPDFIDNDSGILGSPTTEMLGLVGPEFGPTDLNGVGFYRVNFSQAVDAIPEPSAFALWSLLGLTVASVRRRRRAS